MIIPTEANFNLFIHLKHKNINNLSLEDIESYISQCIYESFDNDYAHFHGNEKCLDNDLSYHSSYNRYLTILSSDGHRVESSIRINVYKCTSKNHYHSLLPPSIVIPYFIYSLSSIITVLCYRLIEGNSINETCNHFDICPSLYYKWYSKFKNAFTHFKTIILAEKNNQEFKDFILAIDDIHNLSTLIHSSIDRNISSPFRLKDDDTPT